MEENARLLNSLNKVLLYKRIAFDVRICFSMQ